MAKSKYLSKTASVTNNALKNYMMPRVVDNLLGTAGFGNLRYKGITVTQKGQIEVGDGCLILRDEETLDEVGRLRWDGGEIRFEGKVGESAKELLEVLKNYMAMEKMRK